MNNRAADRRDHRTKPDQVENPGKSMLERTTMTRNDAPKNRRECLERCEELLNGVKTSPFRPASFPSMLTAAIDQARTGDQFSAIVKFCKSWCLAMIRAHEDYRQRQIQSLIDNTDPGLYFDFCSSKTPKNKTTILELRKKTLENLYKNVPGRETQCEELVDMVLRRFMGDTSVLSPVLCGPPGAGKSFLASNLAGALSGAGLKTGYVCHVLTQSRAGEKYDELCGRLLGSSSQWSNGQAGLIYQQAAANDMVLVFLDEAEKAPDMRDFLIAALDPEQPLEDHFLKDCSLGVNMRSRVLFVLAVNDLSGLNYGGRDPLWSRLNPLDCPAYSSEQMMQVLVSSVAAGANAVFKTDRMHLEELAHESLQQLGHDTDLRKMRNHLNGLLFREQILGTEKKVAAKTGGKVVPLKR